MSDPQGPESEQGTDPIDEMTVRRLPARTPASARGAELADTAQPEGSEPVQYQTPVTQPAPVTKVSQEDLQQQWGYSANSEPVSQAHVSSTQVPPQPNPETPVASTSGSATSPATAVAPQGASAQPVQGAALPAAPAQSVASPVAPVQPVSPNQSESAQANGADYAAVVGNSLTAQYLKGIAPEAWKSAASYAGLALAGAFIAALITSVLLAIAIESTEPDLALQQISDNWFSVAVLLTGMGFFNALGTEVSVSTGDLLGLGGSVSMGITAYMVPLVVPLGAYLAVHLGGKKLVAPLGTKVTGGQRVLLSAVAGLGFALVLLLLTSLFAFEASAELFDLGGSFGVRARSAAGFFAGALIVGAIVYAHLGSLNLERIPTIWRQACRTAAEHSLVLAVVAGIAGIIALVISADDGKLATILLFPLAVPLLGTNGSALLHLGSLSAKGATQMIASAADTNRVSINMFSAELPGWARIVFPLVAILAVLAFSMRWRMRRGTIGASSQEWLVLPASYALVGVLVTVVSSISAKTTGQLSALGGFSGKAGPESWLLFAYAAIGLLVVVLARFAFDLLVGILPKGLVAVLLYKANAGSGQGNGVPVALSDAPTRTPAPVPQPAQESVQQSAQEPVQQSAQEPVQQFEQLAVPRVVSQSSDQVRPAVSYMPEGHEAASVKAEPVAQVNPLEAAKPLDPKAKKRIKIGGVALIALAVLFAGGKFAHKQLSEGMFGPQHIAEDYLTALVDGDVESAMKLSAPNVKNAQRALLNNEIYQAIENRITAYRIEATEVTENGAVVRAQVSQDGREYPIVFNVQKDGKQGFIFDGWRLGATEWAKLEIGSVPEEMLVNGVAVKLPARQVLVPGEAPKASEQAYDEMHASEYEAENGSDHSVVLLPGRYVFQAPKASKFIGYGEDIVIEVTPADMGVVLNSSVQFETAYTAALVSEVQDAVGAEIQKCIKGSALEVEGCEIANFEDQYWEAMTDISRSWQDDPLIEVVDEEGARAAESSEASALRGSDLWVEIANGGIRIDYKVRDNAEDEWVERYEIIYPFMADSWEALRMPITIDGDKLSVDMSALKVEPEGWRKQR